MGTTTTSVVTGSADDILSRIKAVLPASWYPDMTPVLDALLGGLAAAWSGLYAAIQYVRLQTRIETATGVFLDIIAQDFFAGRLLRRPGQSDDGLRRRVLLELLRERGTRADVVSVLEDLTGRTPTVFEPARIQDTGAWNLTLGYGVAGAWGSLALPFQAFVTAYRPAATGIANSAGYGSGGWSVNAEQYASLAMIAGQVTDADIYQAVADVIPAASIAWTAIGS